MFPVLPLRLPPPEPETHAQKEARVFREAELIARRQNRRTRKRRPIRLLARLLASLLSKYAKGPLRQQRPPATRDSAAQNLGP